MSGVGTLRQTVRGLSVVLLLALSPFAPWTLAARGAAPTLAHQTIHQTLFDGLKVLPPKQRNVAPPFSLTTPDNQPIALADYAGKVVLINFWATWCGPCVKELPDLSALAQRYEAQGLVVIGVNVDRGRPKPVRKFISKNHLVLPVALDPKGSVRQQYEVIALPTTYLIGRDGRFLGKAMGERAWNGAAAHQLIEAALK